MSAFINSIDDDRKRQDCKTLVAMMSKATGARPVLWGPAIIGFDEYDYPGPNGTTRKWFKAGFSPRKSALTLYLLGGKDAKLLARLGRASRSAGCLYIKRLEDVDAAVLQKLIAASIKRLGKAKKTK